MVISETQLLNDTTVKSFEVLLERAFANVFNDKASVFISHKHEEEQLVYRLREILKRYGFEGYVDWEDDSMPALTSEKTAQQLKERIISSTKFIFIATDASIASKWCNWEIGFADAHKYIDKMAIFPIKKDNQTFKGNEYLNLYPSLQINDMIRNDTSLSYYIKYPDGTQYSLRDWLKL
ncbi:MAG: toll/interleukin-1 receptor domain-containing protein [Agriterribacter sp.]